MRYLPLIFLLLPSLMASGVDPSYEVAFEEGRGRLSILVNGALFAVYVYEDAEIPRPYFCNVAAPCGARVTRNHPPDETLDANNLDHAAFHPGVWLAFGDLGGADFWRVKARVRHVRFAGTPGERPGVFTVVNVYETLDTPPRTICEETCTYAITAASEARWITVQSQFRALAPDVAFGDQEEMGLGVRLATGLTVRHGNGTIINSLGGIDEKGTWGKDPDWCAYSGVVEGRRVGMLLTASPNNFRRSWYHNRDYGLMVANPFGKKSMTGPNNDAIAPDATVLPSDTVLSLGFAVCVFSVETDVHPDYAALYRACFQDE